MQRPVERVVLLVPFEEKGEAMKHGACWDSISGEWWTPRYDIANRAAIYHWVPKDNRLRQELKKALQFQQREIRNKARRKRNRH